MKIIVLLVSLYFVFFSFQAENIIADWDTLYNRIFVFEAVEKETGRSVRVMRINKENNSAVYLENDDLVFLHTKLYLLVNYFKKDIKNTLMIGGGGYTFPQYYLAHYPNTTMDVVEIDPGVTALAKKYFRLRDNSQMTIFHEDGRTFLNRTDKKYDAIWGDAFKSFYSPPFQLITLEALQKIENHLVDNGVVLVNIISAIEGSQGKFFRAEYATFKKVFPQVFVFPVQYPNDGFRVQNILLVGVKSDATTRLEIDNPDWQQYLQGQWVKPVPLDLPILTDDFAPVDFYLADAVME